MGIGTDVAFADGGVLVAGAVSTTRTAYLYEGFGSPACDDTDDDGECGRAGRRTPTAFVCQRRTKAGDALVT